MNFAGSFLRKQLEKLDGVFAFGVSSAFDAVVASKKGHKFLYVGGYAASAIHGYPDMGILTETEMFQHIQYINDVVKKDDICLIVDIDNGYGGVHNVRRTVYDLCEKTSAVGGFHLEDQVIPKRCGHIAGKELVSAEEYLAKLKAAIDMKNSIDPSRVVIARTDAFSAVGGKKDESVGGDIEEAISRGLKYSYAGADLVWCEFPTPDKKSAKAFAEGMKKFTPVLGLAFNISPSFDWNACESPVSMEDLKKWGYRFLFSTYPSLSVSATAVDNAANDFLGDPVEALKGLQMSVRGTAGESIKKTMSVDKYQAVEMVYDPKAKKRIESTDGFKK